jgi:type VI secretion system protein ImpG
VSDSSQNELLAYFQDELTYLRESGKEFADRYPKVAARLELGPDGSADPHVERLLEAFAFLTARIRMNLDQQFPEITNALLDVLYPQYLAPLPSSTVAQFNVDPSQGKITTGHRIERETPVFAASMDGVEARFRTTSPVTLWPLEVEEAQIESSDRYDFLDRRTDVQSVVRVRLRALEGSLQELELNSLRFYLNAELRSASNLYELLLGQAVGVVVVPQHGSRSWRPASAIRPVGFDDEDALLPYPPQALAGYRLLQEYFAFPRKFMFVDVGELAGTMAGEHVDLLFLLGRVPDRFLSVSKETFALGCAPIVNLFRKTTEPLRLDQRKFEYRLVPDVRRERSTEIHSILSVSRSADDGNESERLDPYYAFGHDAEVEAGGGFWVSRRIPSSRRDIPGSEILISFVDRHFDPAAPAWQTVYAHTLCTNRRLAEQLPHGARLEMDSTAPVSGIVALHRPSAQIDPPAATESRWRLISQLSLNHLSLSGDEEGLRALREILGLHAASAEPAVQRQVSGVRGLSTRPVVGRMGREAWRGFIQGIEVTVTLDEEAFAGTNGFVFGSVLRHFFGLYASVNTFTQLVLRTTRSQEIWKKWPPLAGSREIL